MSMTLPELRGRARGRCQRMMSSLFFRRPLRLRNAIPYISFTFDDFPRSSLIVGAEILERFGLHATYYASLGLMGTEAPTGAIFTEEDLCRLLAGRHELGCHTFSHCHSWNTRPGVFEASIIRNRQALNRLAPTASFRSLSYPVIGPRPATKRRAARHFPCCRAGGQTFNAGTIDLNLLRSFFLEKVRGRPEPVEQLIERNRRANGWLIFATHDVSPAPTPYGCTPAFFERIVRCSVDSGARILPVGEALTTLVRDVA